MNRQIGVAYPITPGRSLPNVGQSENYSRGRGISDKKLSVINIDTGIAFTDKIFTVSGTFLYFLHDIAKFPAGVPAGCYFRYKDITSDRIPIPKSNVDAMANTIATPILSIGGIPFDKLLITVPGIAGGFTIVVGMENIDDTIRQ